MVFCYKIITETPTRSGNASPRKQSPARRQSPIRKLPSNVPSSLSQLIGTVDYDNESVLDSIPEREWRLLAALARKREEDDEREKLAEQFRKLWEKEKEEREMVEAETNQQYKQYLNRKRQQERSWNEYKRQLLSAEQQMRRGQLMDSIRHKDRKSRQLLAWSEDKKTTELLDKALEEEARIAQAADRRCRQVEAEQLRRHLEMAHAQKKALDAGNKRTALLRDSAQRVAISNALSTWEASVLRQEISALEAARRVHYAVNAALTEERSASIARERARKLKRARKIAAITAQMREDLKSGRVSVCQ